MSHLFLVGFSWSGKTTVGRALARRLGRRFVDTDEEITRLTGLPVPAVFRQRGETAFRTLERRVIRELLNGASRPMVIALGGGALLDRRNRELVRRTGSIVWLTCSQREIYRRLRDKLDRPLLAVRPQRGETYAVAVRRRIAELMADRLPGYRLADLRVSTTGKTVAEIVDTLIARWEGHRGRR